MTPIVTMEEHNLGDQLVFLHLLRALAKQHPEREFWHFCNGCHIGQLIPVVSDLPNIKLLSFESYEWKGGHAVPINVWKNVGGTGNHDGFWEKSKNRWDWSAFTLEHHAHIARLMGLDSPFTIPEHLLFDYPALNPNNIGGSYFYDFLIINSEPNSGQFGPMKEHGTGYLDELVKQLAKKHTVITTNPVHGVECTRDSKKSITDIGRLSRMCRSHIMVATGPMWGTLNTTNNHYREGRKRIVLLDNMEQLNMPGITQCTTLGQVLDLAKKENWI